MKTPERVVACPTCRGPAVFSTGNRWRPFCSERCRSADLGAWASETYRVPLEGSTGAAEAAMGPGSDADAAH
jgi:endogenous inhibitor of DNA gyrase (YacG/DUF329 family)